MYKFSLFIFLSSFIISCETKKKQDLQLQSFATVLSGKFSSKEQASREPGYSAVIFSNTPIWRERSGYWFYQELYDAEKNTSVYYQRIINVKRVDSLIISSTSYMIPNQKKYKNAWKNPQVLNHLTKDSLAIRNGCDVHFKNTVSSIYQGKTQKGTCLSSFSEKISYTTSDILISKNKISSWDRGYDSNGKQIWGKIQGPYIFRRISED